MWEVPQVGMIGVWLRLSCLHVCPGVPAQKAKDSHAKTQPRGRRPGRDSGGQGSGRSRWRLGGDSGTGNSECPPSGGSETGNSGSMPPGGSDFDGLPSGWSGTRGEETGGESVRSPSPGGSRTGRVGVESPPPGSSGNRGEGESPPPGRSGTGDGEESLPPGGSGTGVVGTVAVLWDLWLRLGLQREDGLTSRMSRIPYESGRARRNPDRSWGNDSTNGGNWTKVQNKNGEQE